ncbi:MAG: exo-alpha-sialidase [Actinomycetia bacterium]|nr:exo-alpha-sialidase [Actinomycetes bacterium]
MSRLSVVRMCAGLVTIAVLLVVAGCSAHDPTPAPTVQSGAVPLSQSLEHLHGLAVDPADGAVYAGTHNGIWLVNPNTGAIKLVGESRDDYMGFTAAGPGRFMASGHPAPGSDAPNPVGLIESADSGKTWQTIGLEGQVDFHVMAVSGSQVAAWSDGTGLQLSEDGGQSWRNGPDVQPSAMAWFDDVLWMTTGQGLVTLAPGDSVAAAPAGSPDLAAAATASDGSRLWGIASDGSVWSSSDGREWVQDGAIAAAEAFAAADNDTAYVMTADSIKTIQR